MSYQRLTLVGNIGNDFQQQNVNRRFVINGSLAVSKNWKNQNGEKQVKTTWFNISKWSESDLSALVKYLTKGTQLLVVGEVDVKTYTNQQGQVIPQLSVNADEIKLLGSSNNQNSSNQQSQQSNNNNQSGVQDDLPF